jgi:hypothetical protein
LLLECGNCGCTGGGLRVPGKGGAASDDKDVRWIVRENLEKARLARAAPAAAERVAAVLDRAGK